MTNIFQEIGTWANELPYWEQVALDKILSGKVFEENDYKELLQYLLEDEHLVEQTSERKLLQFQDSLLDSLDNNRSITIKQISDLCDVNALVSGQKLTFTPQLTAIYGQNGSGKSGYARVLGSAGFSRGDQDVLPNITKQIEENKVGTAEITIEENGKTKTISYRVGKRCAELSPFYVFDSTSVKVHMTGKNDFSFSPSGLSALGELSSITDQVRAKLHEKINELEKPAEFEKYFAGDSDIRKLIENLDADTDLETLKKLAKLSDSENRRLDELKVEIGSIGLKKYQEELKREEQYLENIRSLNNWLQKANELLGNNALANAGKLIEELLDIEARAKELSVEKFQNEKFTHIGSEIWQDFIKVAKQLADEERGTDQYPENNDVCLLCHQTLSLDAKNLITNLWQYFAGETQIELKRVEAKIENYRTTLNNSKDFDIKTDYSNVVNWLETNNSNFAQQIKNCLEVYQSRWEQVNLDIQTKKSPKTLNAIPDFDVNYLTILAKAQEDKLNDLRAKNPEKRRQELEVEERELQHRKQLATILQDIEKYVNQRLWAREASKAGGTTRHITQKHNQLFDSLVMNRYIQAFEQTLANLGRPMQVEIFTSGRKGSRLKQIVVKAHPTAKNLADPEKVLSEGEKRAVALADFLTEVSLDDTSRGIVLDDPVTSLDLEWRNTIAQVLSKEALTRQVIVFTHDLPFLYRLIEYAEEHNLDKSIHWIKRGDIDNLPGYVYLDNSPALEKEYRKPTRAEECYKNAKNAPPQYQEAILKDGLGALRTTYEAFIVFEMLNEVVVRWGERISFGRLNGIVTDQELINDVISSCERLSRYIEGHLHSDEMAEKPTIETLRNELDTFYSTKNKLKKLK
jgi:energy-coupling factor transporter ATP-binding protein EcfA2